MSDGISSARRSLLIYFLDCRVATVPKYVKRQLEQYGVAGLRPVVLTFMQSPGIRKDLEALKSQGVISGFEIEDGLRSSFAAFEFAFLKFGRGWADGRTDLFFSNAQCFGPFVPVEDLLARRVESNCGIWGVTLLGSGHGAFVEPYFLAIRGQVLADERFVKALEAVRSGRIAPAERMNALSQRLCRDFGCGAYVKIEDMRPIRVFRFEQPFSVNAADYLVRKYKMPFVPVAAFRNSAEDRFPKGGMVVEAIRETFSDYPEGLILDHLRSAAPLSWLKAYPGTLRVLSVPGESHGDLPEGMRVAVKAHLFYPDMVEFACENMARIPVPFDLLCTVCGDDVRDELNAVVRKRLPNLRTMKIAKVPNRGRDIGPWLTALTHEEDDYDVILKYQTKRRLQQPNVFGEAWMSFANACVLGSPDAVREILRMFADDGRLGIVMPSYPPPITITTPSAYMGRPEMKALFEQCRKRYAPGAPAETAAPVFSAGTVFWYRPKALESLRAARLQVEDFPPEPLPPLTILHAMERVIPYVAQSAGYHYHMVLPFGELCRDYELLEGRLLSSVPLDDHPPLPGGGDPLAGLGFRALACATCKAFFHAIKKRSPF